MAQINRTSIVLMVVKGATVNKPEYAQAHQDLDRAARRPLSGTGFTPEVEARKSREATDAHARIRALEAQGRDACVEDQYFVNRLGHGIAHPGRVVAFWANGILTTEDGAPLPESSVLEQLIADALVEHDVTPSTTDGIVSFDVPPNRAFQTKV